MESVLKWALILFKITKKIVTINYKPRSIAITLRSYFIGIYNAFD